MTISATTTSYNSQYTTTKTIAGTGTFTTCSSQVFKRAYTPAATPTIPVEQIEGRRITNAERLRRGWPLQKPEKRHANKRAGVSCTPTTTTVTPTVTATLAPTVTSGVFTTCENTNAVTSYMVTATSTSTSTVYSGTTKTATTYLSTITSFPYYINPQTTSKSLTQLKTQLIEVASTTTSYSATTTKGACNVF